MDVAEEPAEYWTTQQQVLGEWCTVSRKLHGRLPSISLVMLKEIVIIDKSICFCITFFAAGHLQRLKKKSQHK
jgi:hypothetical protein